MLAGRRGLRALPYVLRASTQPPAARASACAHLIVPGVRVGPITPTTSETDLRQLLGGGVEQVELGDSDEMPVPGTVLYPDDVVARLQVTWADSTRTTPRDVIIEEGASLWHTAQGVRLGTTLRRLERLNGRPFMVAHLWGSYWEGRVISWEGGALGAELDTSRLAVTLASERFAEVASTLTPDERRQLDADDRRPLSSELPALRRLDPEVVTLWLRFRRD
jgi:hypothetical protein